eukprot:SAG22_NODE_2665_length_2324_cov_2.117753_2_plen_363_part_00
MLPLELCLRRCLSPPPVSQGSADFVLGPELPDISSTKLRVASKQGDRATLLQLCHPDVAAWMLARDGHGGSCSVPKGGPVSGPQAGAGAGGGGGGGSGSGGGGALMAIVRRTDGGSSTLLRKVATRSRSGDVWTEPRTVVRAGEEVEVLRQEPDTGFAWVRFCGVVGYINSSYFIGREQRAFVSRSDGGPSTLLRKVATTSRDASVFVDSRAVVSNGEEVVVLQYQPEFCRVRKEDGEEGFLNTAYLGAAEVRRTPDDGVGQTLLRKEATTSRSGNVYTTPRRALADGERVQVLEQLKRQTAMGGSYEFALVRTADGAQGFLRGSYVWPLEWTETGVSSMLAPAPKPIDAFNSVPSIRSPTG